MTKVFKYPFRIEDRFVLDLPSGAQICHVAFQAGRPCMWALVDPSAPIERVAFRVFGTGHEIPAGLAVRHVATVLTAEDLTDAGDVFVWHVFEELQ